MTYRHVKGPAGLVPVPDLATDTGAVTPDGLTWTFTLKKGVWFGPPVERAVTSADVEFAFRRIETAKLHAQYGHLYDDLIRGMNGAVDPMPKDISGIDTPDPGTVVFHLTRPAGDFPHRLALPATAPMPPEFAGCFKKAGDYGRDVVSTGPYMLLGADEVDTSSCDTIEPMRGFDPTTFMKLVRNPHYEQATDDPEVRSNHPRGFELEIESNSYEILKRIEAGELHATLGVFPPSAAEGRQRRVTLHRHSLSALSYLAMNVLVPPFDDVHVRRAVNLVLNRNAILRAEGGPPVGVAAVHIFPPSLVKAGPAAYRLGGALAAARREMAASRHDANGDGTCDSSACAGVALVNPPSTPPDVNAYPVIFEDLRAIGVRIEMRELSFGSVESYAGFVKHRMPLTFVRLKAAQYPDPFAIAGSLHSSGIDCEGQINYSEVGITEAQARECGVLRRYLKVADHIPSVDARIDACQALAGTERSTCWASFDDYVMREVAPWAPIRIPSMEIAAGEGLTRFEFDQAFGVTSLAHVAVAAPGTPT